MSPVGSHTKRKNLVLLTVFLVLISSCDYLCGDFNHISPTPLSSTATADISSAINPVTESPIMDLGNPRHEAIFSPEVFYEPAGCQEPPDDYDRVKINDFTLNRRTYAMLQYAASLYEGEIDIIDRAITQGSYSNNGPASFGTHLGGGAVDISVFRTDSFHIVYTEIEPLIRALRTAGFAAWLRDWDDLGEGSPIHIHAIAIGDKELSEPAKDQLTGDRGYFRGFNGLPAQMQDSGLDQHGGPVICQWMRDRGYEDLRQSTPLIEGEIVWQDRLRIVSMNFIADSHDQAQAVAHQLSFLGGRVESPGNMCGPLAAAILRDAGLLPHQPGPINDLKSFWLADPRENGRPWSLFPKDDYMLYQFECPLHEFDFSSWALQPADFLYTYVEYRGIEHLFVVTEVDSAGRAYTVTNQYQDDGTVLVQRYLLYDPGKPGEGIIYHEWMDRNLGRTGYSGFDVLRRKGLEAGSKYVYTIRPGDVLPDLMINFNVTERALEHENPQVDFRNLEVGDQLIIPIPEYDP